MTLTYFKQSNKPRFGTLHPTPDNGLRECVMQAIAGNQGGGSKL